MAEADHQHDTREGSRPLFRSEAMAEPEYGEALAFATPQWRSIGLVAAAALALIVAFASLANFDSIAQARGVVIPVSGISRVISPQAGTISTVYVRQGQRVAAGTPLLKIQSPDRLPGGQAARGEALATYRRQQEVAKQSSAAESMRRSAERQRLAVQAEELAAAAESYRRQERLQIERITKNQDRLRALAPVRAKGYVSETTILALEEALLTQRQRLAELQQQRTEALHELQRTRLRMTEMGAEARKAELDTQSALLALERGATGAQVEAEVMLTAARDGIVSALNVTPGAAVQRGQELAAVVRPGDRLMAELQVPSRASGSLRPGQQVILRYDAFPYQRFGVGHGVIEEAASTAMAINGGRELAYRVRVRLLDAGDFALRPDMGLTASIVTEKRSLLDWLFAPLRQKWREQRRQP